MKIDLRGGDAAQLDVDVLVVGAFAPRDDKKKAKKASGVPAPWANNPLLSSLDEALHGNLVAQALREEFRGKINTALVVSTGGRAKARTIVVFGLGDSKVKPPTARSMAARGSRQANAERGTTVAVVAPSDDAPVLRALAEGAILGGYRFTRYFTADRAPKTAIATATLVAGKANAGMREAVRQGEAIGNAVCLTRDLVNEPPNVLDAPALANRAADMCKENGLKIQVFDKAEIKKRKMTLLLAVNQGSTTEPRFVHMTYTPKGKSKKPLKRIVFVGKGLTFDSGGLCIKPADGMLDMKIDMGGAANVIGVMACIAATKPNVEVHGIFAATDNMPDGNSYRPGDIFPSLDGKFVEIINTDAEGRLVLADALAYARTLEPDLIVDNATLTGACMVALGNGCSGFYSNRDKVADEFKDVLKEAGEQMWHMPLLEDLRDQLKSDNADLKHMGSRYGGSITAALFLREFVGDYPWIHCDIAGPVMADKPSGFYVKGATGHGVLSFLRLVEHYESKK